MQYFGQSLDGVEIAVNSPSQNDPSPKPPDTFLATFTRLISCRDFKAAADMIAELDYSNPLHVFKIICFYELRGAVSEAYNVAKSAVEFFHDLTHDPEELSFHDLFKLCEAYFRCFTHGQWSDAIVSAATILDYLASSSRSRLNSGTVSPPIESDDGLTDFPDLDTVHS